MGQWSLSVTVARLLKGLSELRNVLANNLVLDKTASGSGEGSYEDCFLSANIVDEDMPWDATQVDW